METCISQRPTDEESPESRMREIRLSGLMRGGEMYARLTTAVGSIRHSSLRPLYRYFFRGAPPVHALPIRSRLCFCRGIDLVIGVWVIGTPLDIGHWRLRHGYVYPSTCNLELALRAKINIFAT